MALGFVDLTATVHFKTTLIGFILKWWPHLDKQIIVSLQFTDAIWDEA